MTADARCAMCSGIERIRTNGAANLIADLPHCYVMLGDSQFYRGYCVLLAKHHATELFLLPPSEARGLFDELRLVAEAIAAVVKPWKLNYECLGNQEPHVHWHIFPRDEKDTMRNGPVWERPEALRKVALAPAEHRQLIAALAKQIALRIPDARVPAN